MALQCTSMAQSIPLIRAAAIKPVRRWLENRQQDPTPFFKGVGLDWVLEEDLLLPVPLLAAVRLLAEISRATAPDTPHRIVKGLGGFEIGLIGAEAFSGRTVREGLHRVSRNIHLHCTHEILSVCDSDGPVLVRDGWALQIQDDEVMHYVQQYFVAMIDMICSVANGPRPCLASVGMIGHPEFGLTHIREWLGDRAFKTSTRALEIKIEKSVADSAFPDTVRREAQRQLALGWPVLREGNSLSEDMTVLLRGIMPRTKPTLDKVALCTGMSARTLRRRLEREGTTFSRLLEQSRAQIAISRLQGGSVSAMQDLALELGYANQETLSRAVRRWTGVPPTRVMKGV